MPLPPVKKNESEQEFVSRCAGDSMMVNEYKNQKQRLGVCYSLYKQHKKKMSKGSITEINWDNAREEFLESNNHIIIEP